MGAPAFDAVAAKNFAYSCISGDAAIGNFLA